MIRHSRFRFPIHIGGMDRSVVWLWLLTLLGLLCVYQFTRTPIIAFIAVGLLTVGCVRRLDLGLLLATFCIPTAALYKPFAGGLYAPTDILIAACAVSLLWRVARRAIQWSLTADGLTKVVHRVSMRAIQRCSGLDASVGLLITAAVLSLRVADDRTAAGWALRTTIVAPALFYVALRTISLPPAAWLRFADALVAGAVCLAGNALYRYFIWHYTEATEGVNRILGIYDSPNHLALFWGRVIPIMVCMVAFTTQRARRLVYTLGLLPVLLAFYYTFSRGAWLLSLPVSLLVIFLLRSQHRITISRWWWLAAPGVLVVTGLAVIPLLSSERIASLFNVSSGTNYLRLLLWAGTLRMIAAHPIWGVGLGNFTVQYRHFMLPEAWREPNVLHPHNVVLDSWATSGIPGLLALLWGQLAFFRTALLAYRRLQDPNLAALSLGLLASMATLLSHGLVDTGYSLSDLAFIYMLTNAIMANLHSGSELPEVRS